MTKSEPLTIAQLDLLTYEQILEVTSHRWPSFVKEKTVVHCGIWSADWTLNRSSIVRVYRRDFCSLAFFERASIQAVRRVPGEHYRSNVDCISRLVTCYDGVITQEMHRFWSVHKCYRIFAQLERDGLLGYQTRSK